jgi:anti-sigma regulatory factor (Ser/Thr protein kinase)
VSTATARAWTGRAHLVQFYDNDRELTDSVAGFVLDALSGAEIAIVVASAEHRRALAEELADAGIDVAVATADGSLICLDAEAMLRRFMAGSHPDPERFDTTVGTLVRTAAATGRGVRIYGEMVAVLWNDGRVTSALALEQLWNDLARSVAFTLLCGYPAHASLAGSDAIDGVCAAHSAVVAPRRLARPVARTFARATTAPASARRFVSSTLRTWGVLEQVDDIALIASELTTNAVRYGGGPITITLSATVEAFRVAVADAGPELPRPHTPLAEALSGRGLWIVDMLAASWGYERTGNGKVVWAECVR